MGPHLTTLNCERISENEAWTREARQQLSYLLSQVRDFVKAEEERVRNDANARFIRLYGRNGDFMDSLRELSARVTELTEANHLIQQRIAGLEQQMVQETLMNGDQTEIMEPTQGSSSGMQEPALVKASASGPPPMGQQSRCRHCGKLLSKVYVRVHEKIHCPIVKQMMNPVSSTVTGSSRVTSPVDYL